MRMDPTDTNSFTAAYVVNNFGEKTLADIIYRVLCFVFIFFFLSFLVFISFMLCFSCICNLYFF